MKQATSRSENGATAAPRKGLHGITDLDSFHQWADGECQAARSHPRDAQGSPETLRKSAPKEKRELDPFTDEELAQIFAPRSYLAFNSAADCFWAPLLSLHIGARLKEIVTLELDQFQQHVGAGLWYVNLSSEHTRNQSSMRRIPLPQRILDLGFTDYVDSLRRMDARVLFPHQKMDTQTFLDDPSKNCSRRFGRYLESIDLVSSTLVFHSLRQTAITRLVQGEVPISDSMCIVGHQFQEYAARTRVIGIQQARSAQALPGFHGDACARGHDFPLARLKVWLDDTLKFPLDYPTLRKAATVVTKNTRKSRNTPHRIESGWPRLSKVYADRQLKLLT